MSERPYYDRAWKALEAAHQACFKHPDRDVLGMSHGPFSGVNEALGIIDELECEVRHLRASAQPKPMEGHNEPCAFCGEPCNSLVGNPSLWPLGFCHYEGTGKVKWHHTGCVTERLFRASAQEARDPEAEAIDESVALLDVMATVRETEDADVNFLLEKLTLHHLTNEGKLAVVKSFRHQCIHVGASEMYARINKLCAPYTTGSK